MTAETKIAPNGEKLIRYIAPQDIPRLGVKKGDKGGWIGLRVKIDVTAWVSGNAWVYGDARVYGDAQVSGDARVYGNARVGKTMPNANRSDGYTFSIFNAKVGFCIIAGCRYFTSFKEARAHWKHRKGTALGRETDMILDYLEGVKKLYKIGVKK